MTAEQGHRFALTGHDPEGRNRTIVLWREADLVEGRVVRRVVVTLDAWGDLTPAGGLRPPNNPGGGANRAGKNSTGALLDLHCSREV